MKNTVTNRPLSGGVWVRMGILVVILALVAPFGPAAEQERDPAAFASRFPGLAGRNSPVGTWNFLAKLDCTPPNCPFPVNQFIGVETFNSDGTMHVVPNIPGVTIGAGVWKQTGFDRYTFTFTFFRPGPGPAGSSLMIPVLVNENLRMIDRDHYITTDTIRLVDEKGGFPGDFPGKVTATRYTFSNYNQVLP